MRLFGPGEEGVTPCLTPNNRTNWDTAIDALGFTINSYTIKISFPRVKVDAIKSLLREQWPVTRRQAKVREVLIMARKLWKLTYVVRAGKYFLWRLLRLTGLHDSRDSHNQNNTVELGRKFHADLLFWKRAIDNELLLEGEALRAPCDTAIKRPANRHYLSDASFEPVGEFCVGKKVFWRYDLPRELTA